ncbi:P-loop containing nucleoside triphosphate hydrolase protein [Apiospora saccharicola]
MMGLCLSKLRFGNQRSVTRSGTEESPGDQNDQNEPHAKGKRPQHLGISSRPDDSEPRESNSPDSLLSMGDHTFVGSESSPTTTGGPQHKMRNNRQLSLASSKPNIQWNTLPSVIHHPETNAEVFGWEMRGEKRAMRILCSDLCKGLSRLAAETPGDWTESSEHVVVEPYELIFHNMTRIKENKMAKLGAGNWHKHLHFLLKSLEKESPDAWGRFNAIEAGRRKTVTFDTLPLLYRPGTVAFQRDHGEWRAYVIERRGQKMSSNTEVMLIHARYLDFDQTGSTLVPHETVFELAKFDSEQPITDLELIPRQLFSQAQKQEMMDGIRVRGDEYRNYGDKVWHCEYRGEEWPRPSQRYAQSLGIINAKEHGASYSIKVDEPLGLASSPGYIEHQHDLRTVQPEPPSLFCPSRLWAFSLHHKTWRLVSPYDLSEVKKRDEPFDDDLCMDKRKKDYFKSIALEYVDALNQGKTLKATAQKGRGLSVLLCGNTGVGKTFTAECLSEKYGLPLYTMTCGDLGDEPSSFDLRLHETFLRGISWGAIVLLDEVDEYVYSRNRYNNKRCYLTPILLRHLETSESLTIITMTQTEEAEGSFIGRSEWPMHLPDFSFEDQQKVWHKTIDSIPLQLRNKQQLKRFVDHELQKDGYRAFQQLNARQIKNTVRFATANARGNGPDSLACELDSGDIKIALDLGKEFRDHMLQESSDSPNQSMVNQLKVLGGSG